MHRSGFYFSRFRSVLGVAKATISLFIIGIAIVLPLLVVPDCIRWWQARREQRLQQEREPLALPAIRVSHADVVAVTIPRDRWRDVGLEVSQVVTDVARRPLKMEGVLYLDPDDYAQIRSRFTGEIVEVPQVAADVPHAAGPAGLDHRTLRFGDKVRKGDLLAVVWSRDLGEKKSEFAETLARLAFNRESLKRLEQVRDSIPVNTWREAERRIREEELAAERIEKTLLTWQLSSDEILQLRTELADSIPADEKSSADVASEPPAAVDRWARVELRSPIDGTIVEKNVTVGTLVGLDDTLFKVANLTHLDVRAFAYEDDLAELQRLPEKERKWTIRLQGDTTSQPIEGCFDRISCLIDPVQHTGMVMGWVDNTDLRLRPGQFVTASIAFPDTEPLLGVPAASVVDLDAKSWVLLQDPKVPERFTPVRVIVVRLQHGMACLRRATDHDGRPVLTGNSCVISVGAVEIVAECREYLRAEQVEPDEGLTGATTPPQSDHPPGVIRDPSPKLSAR